MCATEFDKIVQSRIMNAERGRRPSHSSAIAEAVIDNADGDKVYAGYMRSGFGVAALLS